MPDLERKPVATSIRVDHEHTLEMRADMANKTAEVENVTTGEMYTSGGGESDFSTAEVTLNLTIPEGVTPISEGLSYCAIPYPDENHYYEIEYNKATSHKVVILLYRGVGYFPAAQLNVDGVDSYYLAGADATISGNATYDDELGVIVVTGDCTISGEPTQG